MLRIIVFSLVFVPSLLNASIGQATSIQATLFENSGQYPGSHEEYPGFSKSNHHSSDSFLNKVEEFINNAHQSLTMELYELRHPRLKKAIISALNRGVSVRIVMEPDPVSGGCDGFSKVSKNENETCSESREFSSLFSDASESQRSLRHRRSSGIRFYNKNLCKDINSQTEGFCFQHGKLMIRDRYSMLLSTGNFNESNLCSGENLEKNSCYRDISVIIDDPKTAAGLEDLIELDYSVSSECDNELRFQTRYGFFRRPSQSRCAANDMEVDMAKHNAKIEEIMKSSGIAKYVTVNPLKTSNLKNLFKQAKKSIRIQTQYIKQQEWQDALMEALGNNIKVYLTLPSFCHFIQKDYGVGFIDVNTAKGKSGFYSKWLEPYEKVGGDNFSLKIFNRGVPDLDGSPMGYQHAKIVIIDDRLAWVGSTNGSLASTNFNREFGIIFDQAEIVSYLTKIAKSDHELGLSLQEHIPNLHNLDYSMWVRHPGSCKIYDKKELMNRKRKQTSQTEAIKRAKY